jgi:serine/threonine protein kinase/tetratricopeptide (TPR) repeat protein
VATTPAKRACSVCGTLLADDSSYCPVCALHGVLETQGDSVSDISSELRFEHYQVLKNEDGTPMELGRGGMGVTYKAIDTHLRCPVALKIIRAQFIGNESARSRFVREARAAASVRHSNVASVFHLGESGGNYFYAMEFVDGETLEALIHRRGRLEIDLALEIVTQVGAGLTAIHKQHLVHRDIKPSNIMLTWEERRLENVKIIDLGLAKGVTEDALSIAGSFVGTPAYASPEQFAGLGTDIRSDLYSLGVTLWEMLSGKPPFQGSAAELMDQHQHAAPPFVKLTNIPEPIIPLLDVLLAKDPSQRFQNPAQLQKAITKVRAAIGSRSRLTADELRSVNAEVTANLSKRKPRKQTIRWAVGSGLCVAAVAIAWFFFSGRAAFLFNQPANKSIPAEKSVAVLPFENIGASKDDAYFADGVQDEILNNLAKIAQLKVISRTSVMKYRAGTERDLRQIASALGVANVLEGTVRRDGNHVRVSTELVDARNDTTIWADSYDRDLSDIFAIQSEIAQQVASRLRAQLSPEEEKDIAEKPTDNLEAYDLYLQAKHLLETNYWVFQGSEKEIYSRIISLLEEAIQKDGKFALAYCLIAKAHDILYVDGIDRTPERRALGDTAVNEALRLRPDLPEAHLALAAHLYYRYRDFERARVQIAIAGQTLSNNPGLLELTALIDRVQGRWEKAVAGLERAVTLDPQNPELLGNLGETYRCLRRYRDAERMDRAIQLEPDQRMFSLDKAKLAFFEKADLKAARTAFDASPASIKDDVWITRYRVYYAMLDGDFKTAHEIVGKSPNEELFFFTDAIVPHRCADIWLDMVQGNHPTMEEFGVTREQLYRKVEADPTNPALLSALACVDIALGSKELAISEAQRAVEMLPISKDAFEGPIYVRNLALVYAWANEPDLALETLDTLTKIPRGVHYGELKLDPSWDPIRKDPRFDKLLAELAPKD